jgi:hypothetical protein
MAGMARRSAVPAVEPIACPATVRDLVDRFRRNRDAYRARGYNETQVRREFIDPFFAALGWDVDNEQGLAEAYKDVIHEDAIKVGGATEVPDYCFRIGGTRKFFVEAKKPGVNLKTDPEPAYQLRRYAWSAKLPLSILTDFEELAVYDCRLRPDNKDKPSKARILYLTCDEYAERWAEIASIFSKDAVLKGSFDKYAVAARGKRGTAPVDDEFLKEIEGWRDALARNFALRNADLSVRDLNFAVGRTIDRIIFLRMCEDRGIEPYGRLQFLLNGDAVYARLAELFRAADDKYNAGLFYFRQEADRGPPDELTLRLALDDKVLKDILVRLYYPESPYEFGVLSADILGQVYEQFLGKVIRLTAGHRAVVEEKPEVRKAGGVYYTPTYIVDYIVKHTVGKLLEGKAPADVGPDRETKKGKRRKLAKGVEMLRVLDPACGSGSFLLGAYQYLLDWHRDWYVREMTGADPSPDRKGGGSATGAGGKKNPLADARGSDQFRDRESIQSRDRESIQSRDRKGAGSKAESGACRNPLADARGSDQFRDRIYQGAGGQWRLTIREKKRILLNNIYGVDIDPQAVEVTKLSLLLKVLEGESSDTVNHWWLIQHERALPDLSNNIKCGNSLIGPDFYEGKQLDMFDEDQRYQINAFDWQREFPEAFAIRDALPSRDRKGAGSDSGFDAVIGNPPYVNAWELFSGTPEIRDYITNHKQYQTADRHWDLYVVFIERALSLLKQGGLLSFIIPYSYAIQKYGIESRQLILRTCCVESIADLRSIRVFGRVPVITIIPVVRKHHPPLDHQFTVVRPTLGSTLYACAGLEPCHAVSQRLTMDQHESMLRLDMSPAVSRLVERIESDSIILDRLCYINYGAQMSSRTKGGFGKAHVIRDQKASSACKPMVSGREVYRYSIRSAGRYVDWSFADKMYGPRWPGFFESHKLMIRDITGTHRIEATLDYEAFYCDHTVLCALRKCDITDAREYSADELSESSRYDLRYLCGLVASRLVSAFSYFVLTGEGVRIGGGFHTYPHTIRRFPIRRIDFRDPAHKAKHDRMVSLVQRMLDLHKRLPAAKTAHDKTLLDRQIDATDREIDRLVYELYGLTEEEIGIVEEGTQ